MVIELWTLLFSLYIYIYIIDKDMYDWKEKMIEDERRSLASWNKRRLLIAIPTISLAGAYPNIPYKIKSKVLLILLLCQKASA